jgi:hypothetical protein
MAFHGKPWRKGAPETAPFVAHTFVIFHRIDNQGRLKRLRRYTEKGTLADSNALRLDTSPVRFIEDGGAATAA